MATNGARPIKLKEACERITVGHVGPMADFYTSDGIPFLRSQNITPFQLNLDDIKYIPSSFHEKLKKSALKPGDVAVVRTGYPGTACVIPERFAELNCADLVILTPAKELNPYFLAALFNSAWGIASVAGKLVGVAQQHFNVGAAKEMEVLLPPRAQQDRIAEILSAYHDLIENNQRRIRILEEMARSLYREWFVHFRFPGHGNHSRVASSLGEIPSGWESTDLESICAPKSGVQTGPFGSQLHEADYSDKGVPVVMPKNLIDYRIRTDGITYIPEATADKLSRHRMQPSDIVYGRRGDIGRRAFVMAHQAGWFCGTGCLRIRPNPEAVNSWFLFNYLGQDDVVGMIAGRAQGVTMPNLNTGMLSSLPVRLPPRDLQDRFEQLTFPMAKAREGLYVKNENLRRTRDLLLPRLLSGQIELEVD